MSKYRQNRHLLIISGILFAVIYASTFTKGYGLFIDEMYYIASALRPAAGYADNPPFAPLVLSAWGAIFGFSVASLRFLPALCAGATALLTGLLARELGANKNGQSLAAIAIACSPAFIALSGYYSMSAFEPIIAVSMFFFIAKMINDGNTRRWIWIGVLIGMGLMNKYTFFMPALAIVLALAASNHRNLLLNRYFAFSVLIAFMIFSFNMGWEFSHQFPAAELYKNMFHLTSTSISPIEYILKVIVRFSPFVFLVWAGSFFLFLTKHPAKKFLPLILAFVMVFAAIILSGTSSIDSMSIILPVAIAFGAVYWSYVCEHLKLSWPVVALSGTLVIFSIATLPVVLPVFSDNSVGNLDKPEKVSSFDPHRNLFVARPD